MRLWRYCIAGLLYDWLIYVFWTVLPIRAEEYGASATRLALLQTASTAFYVLSSLFVGRLSDRASPSLLARLGCAGAIATCLAAASANNLLGLFLVAPLLGLSASLYWPSVQGALGAETDPARMERAIGLFNVTWSIGKSLGFATAGWLDAKSGHRITLWAAAGAAVPILLFYPRDVPRRAAAPDEGPHPERSAYRTLGYIANFMAFGVGAVFQNQFYKYLDANRLGTLLDRKTFFGIFLGILFAAQTVSFVVLQRGRGWTYRRGLLYASQALIVVATGAVPFTRSDLLLLALAPMIGVGLGFAYASSIYYSLHGPSDHGKYAGLHEAVLGAGTILIPLVGGRLADLTGDLRVPYWLATALVVGGIGVEEIAYRRSSRS